MCVFVGLVLVRHAFRSTEFIGNDVISTPLNHVPNTVIDKYLGPVDIHFIKEVFSASEKGGLGKKKKKKEGESR